MVNANSNQNIHTLILVARMAAGKSEIIPYPTRLDLKDRRNEFHVGELKIIDDFLFVWR